MFTKEHEGSEALEVVGEMTYRGFAGLTSSNYIQKKVQNEVLLMDHPKPRLIITKLGTHTGMQSSTIQIYS